MRFGIAIAAVVAAVAFTGSADAQTVKKKKNVYTNYDRTVSVMEDEDGRKRTRIIVQRRSYLDAGTNVLPGQRKFTDYVYGPNYSVTAPIDGTMGYHRSPLPGPFDLPGNRNPMQF